jgi:acetyl-CoA acyltransferase
LLITTSEVAPSLGLRPLARFHSSVVLGVDPVTMLTGPIPATAAVLRRSGFRLEDIGAFEVNEAFASVLGAWQAETGADWARVNPNGGAIALGHPLGATGARLMTSLVHHMIDNQIDYGLQTMCEGGGMANATVLERIR